MVEAIGVDHQRVFAADADSPRDRRGRQRVIAGDDDHADPGRVAAGDRVCDLGPWRIEHRHEPDEAQPLLGRFARRRLGRQRQRPSSERQHALSLAGVVGDPPGDLLAARSSQCDLGTVAIENRGAGRQHGLGRALGVQPVEAVAGVERAHQLAVRVEVVFVAAGPFTPVGLNIAAQRPCGLQYRDLGRVARRVLLVVQARVAAARRGLDQSAQRRLRRSGLGAPLRRRALISPAQVQTATGCIRFSVSVPVLSVQITSVLPSVSTELIRLTTAPRRARSVTATASDRVIDWKQPLGNHACQEPHRKRDGASRRQSRHEDRQRDKCDRQRNRDLGDQPRDPAHLSIERAGFLLDALRERRDPAQFGVHPGGEHDRLRVTTRAHAAAKRSSRACRRGRSRSWYSAERIAGTDSPVIVERSTSTAPDISRMSAAIRSPSSTSAISPGTSSAASTTFGVRSRMTVTF